MKLSLIIPAYNEEKRIERTLRAYAQFFDTKKSPPLETTIIVVLNGCIDNTKGIVTRITKQHPKIVILDLKEVAGKGIAIKEGFLFALAKHSPDLIGFVDADMATSPEEFYKLVEHTEQYDCVIASRYMPESKISPPRPLWKRWGSRLIYEPLIRLLFGISHYDFQCGAKLFKKDAVDHFIHEVTEQKWAIDLELLYLCKKNNFSVKEIPTIWHDQADSTFKLSAGFGMIRSLFYLRILHSYYFKKYIKNN